MNEKSIDARELVHRILLIALYLFTLISVIFFLVYGLPYYSLPLHERPHSELHSLWKPSGFIGHGLGILGTLLLISLLGYVARKNLRFLQNAGSTRRWLDFHIWMGITGPLLITLHSAFKFGGIVSVAYWSMVAVTVSGFIGRYLYLQIPRTMDGEELSRAEITGRINESLSRVKENLPDLEFDLDQLFNPGDRTEGKFWAGSWLLEDFKSRKKLGEFKQALLNSGEVSKTEIADLSATIRKSLVLNRKLSLLDRARQYLHYWHVIHRPFAIIMYVIVIVHVLVAILFGYTWIL